MAASRKSPLAPLAPLFHLLNWVAFAGWSYVLFLLISWHHNSNNDDDNSTTMTEGQALLSTTCTPILVLEGICVVEVLRIFLRDLPGNLTLGVILHAIRFTAILEVLPRAVVLAAGDTAQWTWTAPAILFSWAITEVTRYPMYLVPSSQLCRSIRMVVPLVTFPIGAFSEFCGAYQVFFAATGEEENDKIPLWLQMILVVMMLVNGILGPYLAYPALLKKGLPILGLANEKPKIRTV